MKKIKLLMLGMGLLFAFTAAPVYAEDSDTEAKTGIWGGCTGNEAICGDTTEAEGIAKRIINIFLYAIGILSVVMIIFGGLKYVTSRGDPEMVKSAKNTLLYAVIGLIVALLSFAIVNFVIDSFDTSEEDTGQQLGEEASNAVPSTNGDGGGS